VAPWPKIVSQRGESMDVGEARPPWEQYAWSWATMPLPAAAKMERSSGCGGW
jgi:hypothetical protein